MPIKSVSIEFGGLCMYVQRADGLFVLMPDMSKHFFDRHSAVMVVEPEYTDRPRALMISLHGRAIDLRSDMVTPGGAHGPIDLPWALNVSAYSKNKPVADRWLTDKPTDCLAARVVLPNGVKLDPHGPPGYINVDKVEGTLTVRGRAGVVLTPRDANLEVLDVKDTVTGNLIATLHPKADGTIRFFVVNIQLCDINRAGPRKSHPKGSESSHPQSYYRLLDDHCELQPGRPKFWVARETSGSGEVCWFWQNHGPSDREEFDFRPPMTFSSEWVDTHDCTQGTGS